MSITAASRHLKVMWDGVVRHGRSMFSVGVFG
ncbi:hypothetical protein J2730_004804 [Chitinophaga ginsengisegetis]|nr:hypothetical protein [Chitinophaga ginsengisegetis]MDR6649528.1 hypothetical protein [Chitinophaga ginsengisegetis]MDR6655878.1 hypothetical protein [Chitinophaga ginsengisegetis]